MNMALHAAEIGWLMISFSVSVFILGGAYNLFKPSK